MDVLLNNLAAALGLGEDPRIVYALAAAALLALVSLVSGLGRFDVAALVRPATLLRFCFGVLLAFALTVLGHGWLAADPTASAPPGALLVGLSRVPLYLLALAYGPTPGLLAGALYAAATADGQYPGWPEAILALELTVLGWLALAPSPRRTRWAGPLAAPVAYLLAIGTAGVAHSVWLTGDVSLAGLVTEQATSLPGLVAAWALLALFGPGFYQRYLGGSRIAPLGAAQRREPGSPPTNMDDAESWQPRAVTTTFEAPVLERGGRSSSRRLQEHAWHSDDPNG